jgi:hypothetical protein
MAAVVAVHARYQGRPAVRQPTIQRNQDTCVRLVDHTQAWVAPLPTL